MINGNAEIKFGGKIGFELASLSNCETPNVVLMLKEYNETHEIGTSGVHYDALKPQVFMEFFNPKSIDVVIECLEIAKQKLLENIHGKESEINHEKI